MVRKAPDPARGRVRMNLRNKHLSPLHLLQHPRSVVKAKSPSRTRKVAKKKTPNHLRNEPKRLRRKRKILRQKMAMTRNPS